MKSNYRLLLPAVLLLTLLAGCSLPELRTDGIIPQTGPQAQGDYPAPGAPLEAPGDQAETAWPTLEGDDDDLEIPDTPLPAGEASPTVTLAFLMPPPGSGTNTPNSLTSSPPAFLGAPTTPAPALSGTATLPPALATFTPEGAQLTGSPTATPTPSQTASITPSMTATLSAASATAVPSPAAAATQGPVRTSLLGNEQLFSELADSQVRNLEQGEIGEVRGMVFDSLTGLPLYAVVDPGRWEGWVPGLGSRLVPVPWGALNLAGVGFYQPQAGILLLPVADHVLSTAPTIDEELWDGQNPPADWDTGVDDYWVNFVPIVPVTGSDGQVQTSGDGSTPLVNGPPLLLEEGMLRGRGIDVTDSEGETIGRVKDVVIDANGNARYAVVLVDDLFGFGGRLAPVPWSRLVWSPGGWFILQGPPALLQSAPGYASRDAFPDFSQPDWDREIQGYWGQ